MIPERKQKRADTTLSPLTFLKFCFILKLTVVSKLSLTSGFSRASSCSSLEVRASTEQFSMAVMVAVVAVLPMMAASPKKKPGDWWQRRMGEPAGPDAVTATLPDTRIPKTMPIPPSAMTTPPFL